MLVVMNNRNVDGEVEDRWVGGYKQENFVCRIPFDSCMHETLKACPRRVSLVMNCATSDDSGLTFMTSFGGGRLA